jgi:hypothetical protein
MGGHSSLKSEIDQWPTLAEEDQEGQELGREFQGSRRDYFNRKPGSRTKIKRHNFR